MGLLSTLKSLLGMEEEGGSAGSGVDVTVEREPSAESERAVKEPDEEIESEPEDEPEPEVTEEEAGDEELEDEGAGDEEPVVDTADLEDETVEDEATEDEVEEPAAAKTDDASTESFVDEDHTDDPTPPAEPADTEEVDAGEGEPVTVLKGIGPAYADRLSDAGVDTVEELATADVEDLAERVDLSPKRVGRWVETAQNYE